MYWPPPGGKKPMKPPTDRRLVEGGTMAENLRTESHSANASQKQGGNNMLQTVTGTESKKKPSTNGGHKPTVIEEVFRVIHEQLIDNDGDNSEAFEVALDHIKAGRLQKALFDEAGLHIVRVLWNDLAGGREENRHPEPLKQIKGVRPKVKRYTPGGIWDRWISLGLLGKSKLMGDLTVPDIDIIMKAYSSHLRGTENNKAKWGKLRLMLMKSKKQCVRDGVSEEAIKGLKLSTRQLK